MGVVSTLAVAGAAAAAGTIVGHLPYPVEVKEEEGQTRKFSNENLFFFGFVKNSLHNDVCK